MSLRSRRGLGALQFFQAHGPLGRCDYCDDVVARKDLKPYIIYAGEPISSANQNNFGPMPQLPISSTEHDTGFLVCPKCLNKPHPNMRYTELGGDPKPVFKARPDDHPTFYLVTETGIPLATENNERMVY